jgi:hypothetical protein
VRRVFNNRGSGQHNSRTAGDLAPENRSNNQEKDPMTITPWPKALLNEGSNASRLASHGKAAMRDILSLACLSSCGLILTHTAFAAMATDTASDVRLVELAAQRFSSDTEVANFAEFFNNAQDGKKTDLIAENATGLDKNPAVAEKWSDRREIQAEWIAWLCNNPAVSAKVAPHGVELCGAKIVGDLDIDNAKVPFNLTFFECRFMGKTVNVAGADLLNLSLQGSMIPKLDGQGLSVSKDLNLSDGFQAKGTVWLQRLKVGGALNCTDAHFHRDEPPRDPTWILAHALDLDSATIGADLSLNQSETIGVLVLSAAKVEGSLFCDGSTFDGRAHDKDHPNRWNDNAIFARNLYVRGDVSLGITKAYGSVDFEGAKIDGSFACNGCVEGPSASLTSEPPASTTPLPLKQSQEATKTLPPTVPKPTPASRALDARFAKIGGSVTLGANFTARDMLDFSYAVIGHSFEMKQSKSLDKNSILYLQNAKVGVLLNPRQGWESARLNLRGFTFSSFDSEVTPPQVDQVEWLRKRQVSFSPQPYEQVATVLRNTGLDDEARKIIIAKNWDVGKQVLAYDRQSLLKSFDIWKALKIAWEWCWYRIIGWGIGYGLHPGNALYVSIAVVLIGWAIFRFGYLTRVLVPTDDDAYFECGEQLKTTYPKFNAFIYSLETFVPIVNLRLSQYWIPNANSAGQFRIVHLSIPVAGSLVRSYLWIHIALGWILTTLWVGAFTGFIKS